MNTANGILGNPKTRRKVSSYEGAHALGKIVFEVRKTPERAGKYEKVFWKILATHHKKFLPMTETAPFAHSCWQARATGMDVWTNIKHKRKTQQFPIYEKQCMQVNQVTCMVECLVSNTQRRILSQKKSQKICDCVKLEFKSNGEWQRPFTETAWNMQYRIRQENENDRWNFWRAIPANWDWIGITGNFLK